MIITKLKGGLGNQLFQYAVGKQLAEINKAELKIDISFFNTYKLHSYSVWPFNICKNIATEHDLEATTTKRKNFLHKLIFKKTHTTRKQELIYIREKYFHFDKSILKLPDNIYLDGYWQSEKYFPDIKETLYNEFSVKEDLKGKNREIAKQINECNSICVHVRRANYVSDKHTNEIHGTCPISYYEKAFEYFKDKFKNTHFFVFSDDKNWVYKNFKFPYAITFVDHNNAENDYEDLRLMTYCKHHIIANSTFSWWGAWLCKNKNKIVFAPNRWFNDHSRNTKDLIPCSWKKI